MFRSLRALLSHHLPPPTPRPPRGLSLGRLTPRRRTDQFSPFLSHFCFCSAVEGLQRRSSSAVRCCVLEREEEPEEAPFFLVPF